MLVLTRKVGERIRIGSQIELTVLRISGGKVKLGFSGSPEVSIQREELSPPAEEPGPPSVPAETADWFSFPDTASSR